MRYCRLPPIFISPQRTQSSTEARTPLFTPVSSVVIAFLVDGNYLAKWMVRIIPGLSTATLRLSRFRAVTVVL